MIGNKDYIGVKTNNHTLKPKKYKNVDNGTFLYYNYSIVIIVCKFEYNYL